jgi:hypothetical protein
MFARDLCHSRIEHFRNAIAFKLKRQSEAIPQIFNRQSSIPACPGWVSGATRFRLPSVTGKGQIIEFGSGNAELCHCGF